MAALKFTKNEWRNQQVHLAQLEKYLPTLQLKKAMLQAQVHETRLRIESQQKLFLQKKEAVFEFAQLLADSSSIDLQKAIKIAKVSKHYENIAGVEVPYFEGIEFEPFEYSLFETAPWVDSAIASLRSLVTLREELNVIKEQKAALEKELRAVSTRVNLFEKILIPRAQENIRVIKVQLSDRELAAVSRAKVAKSKIEAQKQRWLEAHA